MKKFSVGIVGAGALGLPLALAYNLKGHSVYVYDKNPERMDFSWFNEKEKGPDGKTDNFYELLENSTIKYLPFEKIIAHYNLDIYFLILPTNNPLGHGDEITNERYPYEIKYIERFFQDIYDYYDEEYKDYEPVFLNKKYNKKNIIKDEMDKRTFVLGSTLTPGQTREINEKFGINMLYSPNLPGLGTMLKDILNPEFVILGSNDKEKNKNKIEKVKNFYSTIHDKKVLITDTNTAELIKVSYNSFISTKISYINTLMEICEKMPGGANVDDISKAFSLATDRIISSKYLKAGSADSGACFPSGQLVYTKNGVEEIQNIKIGDKVFGSDGKLGEVIEIYERDYEGDLIRIKSTSNEKVLVTPNHKFLVSKDLKVKYYDKENKRWGRHKEGLDNTGEFEWLEAEKLNDDYYTLFPSFNIDINEETLNKEKISSPPTYVFNKDGFTYHKIRKMEREYYIGKVYNLNVEPLHDYLVPVGIVKNCHPSANSALAKLADDLNVSYNYFDNMVKARENQTEWLVDLALEEFNNVENDKVVILGKSFKAESNSYIGSCTNLLENMFKGRGFNFIVYDPYLYEYNVDLPKMSSVFIVSTNHEIFKNLIFPKGSVIIDVWGYIPDNKNYKVRNLGRK